MSVIHKSYETQFSCEETRVIEMSTTLVKHTIICWQHCPHRRNVRTNINKSKCNVNRWHEITPISISIQVFALFTARVLMLHLTLNRVNYTCQSDSCKLTEQAIIQCKSHQITLASFHCHISCQFTKARLNCPLFAMHAADITDLSII